MKLLKKQSATSLIGTILILCSLFGFIFLFYPIIALYLFPPKSLSAIPSKGTYITIPKIFAQAPVIENVDPWDQSSYMAALKKRSSTG